MSVLKVIQKIHEIYPEASVENIGETDFIVTYEEQDGKGGVIHVAKIVMVMKCQKMRTSDSGQHCRIDAFNLQYISKRYRLFCDLYIPVCFYIYIIRIRGHLLHLLFICDILPKRHRLR